MIQTDIPSFTQMCRAYIDQEAERDRLRREAAEAERKLEEVGRAIESALHRAHCLGRAAGSAGVAKAAGCVWYAGPAGLERHPVIGID